MPPIFEALVPAAVESADLAPFALGAAALALLACAVLALRLRRLRRDQRVVLGDDEQGDLVAAVATIARRVDGAERRSEEIATKLADSERALSQRLAGCVARTAIVRYDAYNEMGGQQSSSIALLDAAGTGVVISSILHREQARMYAKPVRDGVGEIELSPEEKSAVATAMGGRL